MPAGGEGKVVAGYLGILEGGGVDTDSDWW